MHPEEGDATHTHAHTSTTHRKRQGHTHIQTRIRTYNHTSAKREKGRLEEKQRTTNIHLCVLFFVATVFRFLNELMVFIVFFATAPGVRELDIF